MVAVDVLVDKVLGGCAYCFGGEWWWVDRQLFAPGGGEAGWDCVSTVATFTMTADMPGGSFAYQFLLTIPCLPFPGCLAHGESVSVGVVASDRPDARHRSEYRWVGCVPSSLFSLPTNSCLPFPAYHSRGAWHTGRVYRSWWLRRTGPMPGTDRGIGGVGVCSFFALLLAHDFPRAIPCLPLLDRDRGIRGVGG